jgi:hypothetical protein
VHDNHQVGVLVWIGLVVLCVALSAFKRTRRALGRLVGAPIKFLDDLGVFGNVYVSGTIDVALTGGLAAVSAYAESKSWKEGSYHWVLIAVLATVLFGFGKARHQAREAKALGREADARKAAEKTAQDLLANAAKVAKKARCEEALESLVPLIGLLSGVRVPRTDWSAVQRELLRHVTNVVAREVSRPPAEINATWSILVDQTEQTATFRSTVRVRPMPLRPEGSTFIARQDEPGAWRALKTLEPSVIADTEAYQESFTPERRGRYRCVIAVPAFTNNADGQNFVGLLSVDHREPNLFGDDGLGVLLTPIAVVIGVCEHQKLQRMR